MVMSNGHYDKIGNLTSTGLSSGQYVSPFWKDINFGPNAVKAGPINSPDIISVDPGNSTNIFTYAFDGGTLLELVFGGKELQHDYKEGEILSPHIHWMPTTTGTGNVKWFLSYYFKKGTTIFVSSVDSIVVATTGTAWEEIRSNFPDISVPTLVIETQLFFSIWRDPTETEDTYSDDAALGSTFGFHYKIDTAGSRQINTKY